MYWQIPLQSSRKKPPEIHFCHFAASGANWTESGWNVFTELRFGVRALTLRTQFGASVGAVEIKSKEIKSGYACVVALVPEKIPSICVKIVLKMLSEYHRNSHLSRWRRR